MGRLEFLRKDPKCRHGNTRGYCSKCDGHVKEGLPGKRTKDLRMSVQKTRKPR